MIFNKKYLLFLLLFRAINAAAQQYNFTNFNVEDGLLQSQATVLCQDSARHLWVGTLGGVSRFDGRRFTHFTRMEGLADNYVTSLFCDRRGRVWVGTSAGVSVFDGKRFGNALISKKEEENFVKNIVQDKSGRIWVLAGHGVFLLEGDIFKRQKITPADTVTALDCDRRGNLLAAVYGSGIFARPHESWEKVAQTPTKLFVEQILIASSGDTLLATHQGLKVLKNRQLQSFDPGSKVLNEAVFTLLESADGSLWEGASQGAVLIPALPGMAPIPNSAPALRQPIPNSAFRIPHSLRLNAKSGLTDHPVSDILQDAEGNLWFASNVGGLFRFNGFRFTRFNEASGLHSPVVMGIAQAGDELFFATLDGGLFRMAEGKISHVALPEQFRSLNCLASDRQGRLFFGVFHKGLWRYEGKGRVVQFQVEGRSPNLGINAVFADEAGNVWAGSNRGFFVAKKGSLLLKKASGLFVGDIRIYGKDTLLLSTSKGAYLFDVQRDTAVPLSLLPLWEANGISAAVFENFVFYGTTDQGLFAFEKNKRELMHFTQREGLPSNFIYNVLVERVPVNIDPPPVTDAAGNLPSPVHRPPSPVHRPSSTVLRVWLGTGYGISCLTLNNDLSIQRVVNYGKDDGLTGMESNHNASFKDAQGKLWFGLTKGLFRLQNDPADEVAGVPPMVNLRSVALFSKTLDSLPASLRLNYQQNHLTFELGGICLRNPESLFFKYRLEGLDEGYTFSASGTTTYPSLPPGKYEFVAFAVTPDSLVSKTPARFAFEIEAPFYRSAWFLTCCYGALLLFVLAFGWLRHQSREQKRRELEQLRTEEFNRLRRRTAEDFHDEMGNKLTRIAVLSDILKMKLRSEQADSQQLVEQIKDNVAALHSGSRDIIWSLHPGHDELNAVVRHIGDIGRELFSETETEFVFENLLDEDPTIEIVGLGVPLSLDVSRNLQMIAKEIFGNALRHAHAKQVVFEAKRLNANEFLLSFSDDGQGFDSGKAAVGNGLKNLRSRAERIGAGLEIRSEKGTKIELRLAQN